MRLATLFVQLKVPFIENKEDFVLYFNQFLGAGHTRTLVEYSFKVVFNILLHRSSFGNRVPKRNNFSPAKAWRNSVTQNSYFLFENNKDKRIYYTF